MDPSTCAGVLCWVFIALGGLGILILFYIGWLTGFKKFPKVLLRKMTLDLAGWELNPEEIVEVLEKTNQISAMSTCRKRSAAIRCNGSLKRIWVQLKNSTKKTRILGCSTCGQHYQLDTYIGVEKTPAGP